jgi:hypothetical protein
VNIAQIAFVSAQERVGAHFDCSDHRHIAVIAIRIAKIIKRNRCRAKKSPEANQKYA